MNPRDRRWFWLAVVVGMLFVPGCQYRCAGEGHPGDLDTMPDTVSAAGCAPVYDASIQPDSDEYRVTGCIPQ